MQTAIEWYKPEETPPPFGKRLLVALGSQVTTNAGATWHMTHSFRTVVIKTESPNSDDDYDDLVNGEGTFDDYQFILVDPDDCDEELDWYSDAIVVWAYPPKLN
jgi:hypothetical protein